MTERWIVGGKGRDRVLAATTGIAYAAGTNTSSLVALPTGKMLGACLAMNDSPAMEAMHQRMPVIFEQQCDASTSG